MQDGKPLGPDFWETVKAVAPLVGVATVYLRLAMTSALEKMRVELLKDIKAEYTSKELVDERMRNMDARLQIVERRST